VSAVPSWAQDDDSDSTGCDADTALVGLSFTSGDRTGPSLTKLAVRSGETVTATWNDWASGCEPQATLAMHDSGTRLFDPSRTEPLMSSVTCTGTDCRGDDGIYSLTITVPTSGVCVAQVDLVLGEALPFIGPPRSFYSAILSRGPNRLISYSRALVDASACDLPTSADSSQVITTQPAPNNPAPPAAPAPEVTTDVTVLAQVIVPTTLPPVPSQPVAQIPTVGGETLAFTGPSSASQAAGFAGGALILIGSALCVSGRRLGKQQY